MLQSAFYKSLYTVIVFLANLLLANLLLPAYYGNINLMIINASIAHLVTGFGIDAIIIYSLTNKKWEVPYALSFALYSFIVQLFIFLLLELLSVQINHHTLLGQNAVNFLLSEIVYFTGLIVTERCITLLYGQNKAALANGILLLVVFVYLAVLIILKNLHVASFSWLLQVFCLQSLLQGCLLFLVVYYRANLQKLFTFNWSGLYGILKLSAVVVITNFIQLLAYRIDFLLLKRFYSDYELGVYAQANKFANLLWIIPRIFALLLMSKFRELEEAKVFLVFRVAAISGVVLTVVTAVITQAFYIYFLNPQYAAGLPSFYLMLPGYFCWSVVIYFGAYFSWRGAFYKNLSISSFCFLLVLLCDLILIPKFSLNGAAIANSIAYSATLLLCFFFLSRQSNIGFVKMFKPRKDDLSLLIKLLK